MGESKVLESPSRDNAAREIDVRASGHAARSRARAYVLTVLLAGGIALAVSVAELASTPQPVQFWILIGLTLLSGSAVLKIPSTSANFSISDVFTLTSAVVFGPSAATVAVALESLLMSARVLRTGL